MMRQYVLILILSVWTLTCGAQTVLSIDQINGMWHTKTITGVNGGDIVQLVEAFNKAYPSKSLTNLLHNVHAKKHNDPRNIVEVDHRNGWLQLQEAVPCEGDCDDGDVDVSNEPEAETVQACVWKRSNGHRLFAVSFSQRSSRVRALVAFFDYDAAKKTLTPEKSLQQLFKPLFPTTYIDIELPREGKTLVITEHFKDVYCPIRHTFDWNGMRPSKEHLEFLNMEMLINMYKEFCICGEDIIFNEYALYDVDEDGIPELFLSTPSPYGGNYIGAYAMNDGNVELLCGQDDKFIFSFYRHAICYSGHGGTVSMLAGYIIVENSRLKTRLVDILEWDYALDDYGPTTYLLDGSEVPAAEAKPIIQSLGEPFEPDLDFQSIDN